MRSTFLYNDDEKELMHGLCKGEESAFKIIYEMHVRQLLAFVMRTVKSKTLAEDVAHDVFVKIWNSRTLINPDLPFKPYLYTITRRHLINLLKRASHENQIIAEVLKEAVTVSYFTDEEIAYQESNKLINEAISQLPAQRKRVFELCRVEGLTYKQAAEQLGISSGTVNDHMVKALKFLKDYLKSRNAMTLLLFPWWWR